MGITGAANKGSAVVSGQGYDAAEGHSQAVALDEVEVRVAALAGPITG